MRVSVVIPTLNEERHIRNCIESAQRISPFEIIVVDGGSEDRTKEIAASFGVKIVDSKKGRGTQLRLGAQIAKGDILLFLHSDVLLPKEMDISDLYLGESFVGGFFKLRYSKRRLSLRLVEFFANLRSRFFSLPYGDQAIFVRKEIYEKIGGIKEQIFLEDLDFVLRLRKLGKLKFVNRALSISARRLERGYFLSPIFHSLKNVVIANLYRLGVSETKLYKFY